MTQVLRPVPDLHLALYAHHPLLTKKPQGFLFGRIGLTPLMSMTPVLRHTASRRAADGASQRPGCCSPVFKAAASLTVARRAADLVGAA